VKLGIHMLPNGSYANCRDQPPSSLAVSNRFALS
jgi:hypothetical protein